MLPAVNATAQYSPARTATNTVSVHVGTVLRLVVRGSTTLVATLPRTSAVAAQDRQGPTAQVRANGAWRLAVSTTRETWTPVDGSARADKPAGDLTVSARPTDGFAPVSAAPADVARGGATGSVEVPLYYRTQFAPDRDTPGTYSLTVRLTLVGA
jgi:hypothetical protein